nr:TolC family protein [Mitsuaria sp. TWR114]
MTSTSFLRPSLPAVAAAVLVALLSGCAVTRVDPPAPVTAPAQYKEDGLWKQARPATAEPVPEQWWTLFDDPVLNDLQRRLVIGNENLKAAVAQLAGARAALEASRSALLPTLSVGVSGTRSASPDGNVTNGTINRGRPTACRPRSTRAGSRTCGAGCGWPARARARRCRPPRTTWRRRG